MGIATRNKRRLVFNERQFVWYVKESRDTGFMVLHVASSDKKFHVLYTLGQPADSRYLEIAGEEFAGLGDRVGRLVLCPGFETDNAITPKNVQDLIGWCFLDEKELVHVDEFGRPLQLERST